tara:strand:- start:20023 stop:20592 length:570 start_codon:yes stop_codon:yes gene_type:complete
MDRLFLIGAGGFWLGALAVILFFLSLFLVFIIMMQRGKGGGIAGSLTGTAQSAFGARGGDALMWITIALTGVWIFLSCVTIYSYSSPKDAGQTQQDEGGASEADTASSDDSSSEDTPLDLSNGTDSLPIAPAIVEEEAASDSTTADETTGEPTEANATTPPETPEEETEEPTTPPTEEGSTEPETPDSE